MAEVYLGVFILWLIWMALTVFVAVDVSKRCPQQMVFWLALCIFGGPFACLCWFLVRPVRKVP